MPRAGIFFRWLKRHSFPLTFSRRTSLKRPFSDKFFRWFYKSDFICVGLSGLVTRRRMHENAPDLSMLFVSLRRTRQRVSHFTLTFSRESRLLTLRLNRAKTTNRGELIFEYVAQGDETNAYMCASFRWDTPRQSSPLSMCQKEAS